MNSNRLIVDSPQFRVWHIPQVPMEPFFVTVKDPFEAATLLRTIWDYDNFQFTKRIKPDYSSASGLEVFENGEWVEWEDEDGDGINERLRAGL